MERKMAIREARVVTIEAGTGLDIWPLDIYQKVVAESYEGGEFRSDIHIESCGDGLFKFLMTEISESEGCDSLEEAQRRLTTIQRQVEEVKREFMTMEDKDNG